MSNQLALSAIKSLQDLLQDPIVQSTNLTEFTNHFFAPGIYARTIFIPKEHLIVGRRQRYEALNILVKGTIAMMNEHGEKIVASAPLIFVSKDGQKAGCSITDVWYITIHPNPDNITDIAELERRFLYPEDNILEVVK